MTTRLAAGDAARASGTPADAAQPALRPHEPPHDSPQEPPHDPRDRRQQRHPRSGRSRGRGPGAGAFIARITGISSIRARLALAAAGAVLVACLLMTVIGYLVERQNIIRGIDSRLLAAAAAVPHMLPAGREGGGYHEPIFEALAAREDLPAEQAVAQVAALAEFEPLYSAAVEGLSEYVSAANLPYLYTYIVRDGAVYLTSVNRRSPLRPQGRSYPFLMRERDPPPGVVATSVDGKVRFVNYTTGSGSFRSILVPVGDDPQRRYIIGADVTLDFMRASLLQRFVQASLVAVIVSVAVGAGAALFAGRLMRPIVRLARAIDTLGANATVSAKAVDARFTGAADGELDRIAQRPDETGRLASSMLAMQDRLRRYLRQLDTVTRAQQRFETQLEIARRIQQALLPRDPPQLSTLEVVAWSQPAEHVGGDFFDWMEAPCPDSEAICILADAAGHGVAAALTAATCRAHARDLLRHCRDSLASGLTEVSDAVGADAADGHFVTLFAAAVQGERVLVASAGHGPILICRAASGAVEQIDATGPPLGVIAGARFAPDHDITLDPGDTLLVVSDGIFEAPAPAPRSDRFGIERLKAILSGCADRTGEEILARLHEEVAAFTGGAAPPDDMTAMVIRRPR